MNRYFDHMHTRSPHERRQHALRVAGVFTALIFAGWVTTFGLSNMGDNSQIVQSSDGAQNAAAVVASSPYAQNQLVVATTSDY